MRHILVKQHLLNSKSLSNSRASARLGITVFSSSKFQTIDRPSSVQMICELCFSHANHLHLFHFENRSRLSRLGKSTSTLTFLRRMKWFVNTVFLVIVTGDHCLQVIRRELWNVLFCCESLISITNGDNNVRFQWIANDPSSFIAWYSWSPFVFWNLWYVERDRNSYNWRSETFIWVDCF